MRRGILAERDELRALGDRIAQKPYDAMYDALQARCALILQSGPVTESQWRSLWQRGRFGSAIRAARTAQGRIIDLLVAHHVDSNPAYRDHAIEELRSLASWSTWVDPCHGAMPADLCTAEAAVAATIGLDWLWEDLHEAHRCEIVETLREKVVQPYLKGLKDHAPWSDCYHSWNAVVNSGCGLACLALGDEQADAQDAYRRSLKALGHFFDALGREGGWDEGTGYWAYAMRYVLLLAEASSRLMDDQTIYHARGMDATGLFGIYFTPNRRATSFGEGASVPVYGALYLFAKHYGLGEVAWWLDRYAFHHDVTNSGFSTAGFSLLFRPDDIEVPDSPALEPMKVFNQIGWAAMADSWPDPGMYVSVKTGDLSASHSQRDMNSIQLQVDGEMLLTHLARPAFNSGFYAEACDEFYDLPPHAHNTVVVAERDQLIDAQGQIADSGKADEYRWVACDAGTACGENVRFIRHVLMLLDPSDGKGQAVIVLDDVNNGVPERMDWFWHTRGEVELDAENLRGEITGQKANVEMAFASTMKILAWDESHQAGGNGSDNVVRLSGGLVGPAMVLSVFSRKNSRRPIGGGVSLELVKDGVQVAACGRTIRFAARKHGLKLLSVTEK